MRVYVNAYLMGVYSVSKQLRLRGQTKRAVVFERVCLQREGQAPFGSHNLMRLRLIGSFPQEIRQWQCQESVLGQWSPYNRALKWFGNAWFHYHENTDPDV